MDELGRVFANLDTDRDVRDIILTGACGAFCAGADISKFSVVRATLEDGRADAAAKRDPVFRGERLTRLSYSAAWA